MAVVFIYLALLLASLCSSDASAIPEENQRQGVIPNIEDEYEYTVDDVYDLCPEHNCPDTCGVLGKKLVVNPAKPGCLDCVCGDPAMHEAVDHKSVRRPCVPSKCNCPPGVGTFELIINGCKTCKCSSWPGPYLKWLVNCEPECVNGACVITNICACDPGWYGAQCEKERNTEFIAGPEGLIWHYEICPEIERLSLRLEECKDECSRRDKCTAFNFNTASTHRNCELLICPQPIPEPTWKYGRSWYCWIGYSIHNGTTTTLKPITTPVTEVEECKDLNSECWSFDVRLCFIPKLKDTCPKKCGVCVEPGW